MVLGLKVLPESSKIYFKINFAELKNISTFALPKRTKEISESEGKRGEGRPGAE